VAVSLGLECMLEDKIAIGLKSNHDILVPQSCSDLKAASVIRVQLAEGVHLDKNLIEWLICRTWGSGRQYWRWQGFELIGLGQPNILVLLGKVTSDHFVGGWDSILPRWSM
jgi:hypothetical protein